MECEALHCHGAHHLCCQLFATACPGSAQIPAVVASAHSAMPLVNTCLPCRAGPACAARTTPLTLTTTATWGPCSTPSSSAQQNRRSLWAFERGGEGTGSCGRSCGGPGPPPLPPAQLFSPRTIHYTQQTPPHCFQQSTYFTAASNANCVRSNKPNYRQCSSCSTHRCAQEEGALCLQRTVPHRGALFCVPTQSSVVSQMFSQSSMGTST